MDQPSAKTVLLDHDEDSKEVNKNNSTMDCYNFLVKQPPLEKDQHDDEYSGEVISNSSEQIKCSNYSLGEFNGCDEDSNEGFKTPTSLEHKIPSVLQCPPAPRKPRISPSLMKRKAPCRRRRIVTPPLDVSDDMIESVFSIAICRRHFHGKIKKVRDVNNVKSNSDYDLLFSGTAS